MQLPVFLGGPCYKVLSECFSLSTEHLVYEIVAYDPSKAAEKVIIAHGFNLKQPSKYVILETDVLTVSLANYHSM